MCSGFFVCVFSIMDVEKQHSGVRQSRLLGRYIAAFYRTKRCILRYLLPALQPFSKASGYPLLALQSLYKAGVGRLAHIIAIP